ncbi:hypothetical protein BJF93_00290 [Xaviernesmea oryzae]|uniref:Uncharacterized protein n=1 Tax=Xaviernesmea oryzae TaxID=464029 RepID=A0A1Q9B0B0_9HYPH|nr:hypothetical protein BJF93_00290 [Xaviernesmea oryzae]
MRRALGQRHHVDREAFIGWGWRLRQRPEQDWQKKQMERERNQDKRSEPCVSIPARQGATGTLWLQGS